MPPPPPGFVSGSQKSISAPANFFGGLMPEAPKPPKLKVAAKDALFGRMVVNNHISTIPLSWVYDALSSPGLTRQVLLYQLSLAAVSGQGISFRCSVEGAVRKLKEFKLGWRLSYGGVGIFDDSESWNDMAGGVLRTSTRPPLNILLQPSSSVPVHEHSP